MHKTAIKKYSNGILWICEVKILKDLKVENVDMTYWIPPLVPP